MQGEAGVEAEDRRKSVGAEPAAKTATVAILRSENGLFGATRSPHTKRLCVAILVGKTGSAHLLRPPHTVGNLQWK